MNDYRQILNSMTEGTQCYLILKHMMEHGSITTIDAFWDYGITRLPARIFNLRSMGVEVTSVRKTIKSDKGERRSYAIYSLSE